jgi:hypothetical protein
MQEEQPQWDDISFAHSHFHVIGKKQRERRG